MERAKDGEEIEVCSGADDVCTRCPYLKEDKCFYERDADAEIREMDSKAMELLKLEVTMKVIWKDIKAKIPGILSQWATDYCKQCDWRTVCEANFSITSGFERH